MEGKYTLELYAKEKGIKRQTALNKIVLLKKKGLVSVKGGGKQKRIYYFHRLPVKKTNGFYDLVNKYSPEKLVPAFEHFVYGNYCVENAILDGIEIGDVRTLEATKYLFRNIKNWKKLFDMAKKKKLEKKVYELYLKARKTTKCKRIPERYKFD